MDVVHLDFETYYDKAYSLSKMTTQEYIVDPRFEALLCSVKINDGPVDIIEGPELAKELAGLHLESRILNAHNTIFDGAILRWRYGITAGFYTDTMSMARSVGIASLTGSVSLAKLVSFFQDAGYTMPSKGKEVAAALGKRRQHFTPADWEAYKEYCKTDSYLTAACWKLLTQVIPAEEIQFQDRILRCFIEPSFRLDEATCAYELHRVRELQRKAIERVSGVLGVPPDSVTTVLRSNAKFAELLRALGGATQAELDAGAVAKFVIPEKVSLTTGKTTWAFGKEDEGFIALCESEDEFLATVCEVRKSAKSSIAESRSESYLRLAKTGFMAIPYTIAGAHTGRLSGCLTARNKVRVLKRDGRVKTVPIHQVRDTDKVWDGTRWCKHDGVADRGLQAVISYDGVEGTIDHPVFVNGKRMRLIDAAEAAIPLDTEG